jgi:hypothetical protein
LILRLRKNGRALRYAADAGTAAGESSHSNSLRLRRVEGTHWRPLEANPAKREPCPRSTSLNDRWVMRGKDGPSMWPAATNPVVQPCEIKSMHTAFKNCKAIKPHEAGSHEAG